MAFGKSQRREMEPGTFLLFKNEEQRPGKQDPHYKGNGKESGGRDVWLSAWVNKAKDGSSYMKIKCEPKQEQRREVYANRQQEASRPPFDDEIPF